MSDPHRVTVHETAMIDAHVEQPRIGQLVWALSQAGVVIQMTWTTDSINHYDAWYPFLKIPESVKERMRNRYKK